MWSRTSILLVILCAGCMAPDPNAPPVIRDVKEYEQTLATVRELTLEPFEAHHEGVSLTSDQTSNLREAARLIDGLIAFQPNKYGPYVLKGLTWRTLGDDDKARQALEQGLVQAPPTPSLDDKVALARMYDLVAQIDFDRKQFTLAEKSASKAVEMAPADTDALTTAASIQVQLGRPAVARSFLNRALRADPKNSRAADLLRLVDMAGG